MPAAVHTGQQWSKRCRLYRNRCLYLPQLVVSVEPPFQVELFHRTGELTAGRFELGRFIGLAAVPGGSRCFGDDLVQIDCSLIVGCAGSVDVLLADGPDVSVSYT